MIKREIILMNKWKLIKSQHEYKAKIFEIYLNHFESVDSNKSGGFNVLKTNDWVNVIALTDNQEIVLIRQFRAGTENITLEIPGGAIDLGEKPQDAAKRELIEETGYDCGDLTFLGKVRPNPAFLNNTSYFYLAQNCTKISGQKLDTLEEIEIILRPKKFLFEAIDNGEIDHSLIISAAYFYQKYINC
jgi:ADP-ribose pyrophosphatase